MRTGWVAFASAAVWLVVGIAQAEPADSTPREQLDAARALAEAGLQLYEQGDLSTALERFRQAEKIVHAPPHLLYIARALEKTGKLVEARDVYRQLVADQIPNAAPPAFRKSQDDGKVELEALLGRMPTIRVTVQLSTPAEASVLLDGSPLDAAALAEPVAVDPGEHTLELRAPGLAPTTRTISVAADDRELAVALGAGAGAEGSDEEPNTDEPASDGGPSLAPPLVVLGVGVAGLGVGIVTGVLTLNDAAELKNRCPTNPCAPDNESLADSVHTLGTVSTVAFIAGGAAAGAGLLWLALVAGGQDAEPATEPASEGGEPAPEATATVLPMVGLGFFGVRGEF